MTIQLCRSCNARMYMLKHVDTGKYNPIDADPAPNGNISIDLEKEIYRILTKDVLAVAKESGADLYVSHFVTCPDRKKFRK